MIISHEIARMAMAGVQILTNGELFVSYEGKIPSDFESALKIVQKHPQEFKNLTLQVMNEMQYFPIVFGKLVKTRLNQKGYLASQLIESVFDLERKVEQRLERIIPNVIGISTITSEHQNTASDKNLGYKTDEIARNLLAEILLLDFLVYAGFVSIERPYSQSLPHVDILAIKEHKKYAIEVARKKEFSQWETLEFGSLEDCESSANLQKMRSLLSSVLKKKDKQFFRIINAGTIDNNVIRVVAVKTSDYGFAECASEAEKIIQNILSVTENFSRVDCVWFIPNVSIEQGKWICRSKACHR
jgi:Holliday junction resolvase